MTKEDLCKGLLRLISQLFVQFSGNGEEGVEEEERKSAKDVLENRGILGRNLNSEQCRTSK